MREAHENTRRELLVAGLTIAVGTLTAQAEEGNDEKGVTAPEDLMKDVLTHQKITP